MSGLEFGVAVLAYLLFVCIAGAIARLLMWLEERRRK